MDGRDPADAQEVAGGASDAPSRDRALVERYLRTRDEAAFLGLYRSHTPALLGLASRLCAGELSAAEEIVQEAWVRAAQSLPSFRWESRLRTWLSGVVVNSWRDWVRARGREEAWERELDAVPGGSPGVRTARPRKGGGRSSERVPRRPRAARRRGLHAFGDCELARNRSRHVQEPARPGASGGAAAPFRGGRGFAERRAQWTKHGMN